MRYSAKLEKDTGHYAALNKNDGQSFTLEARSNVFSSGSQYLATYTMEIMTIHDDIARQDILGSNCI